MSSAKTCQPPPDQRRPQEASVPAARGPVVGLSSAKVQRWHLDRLAFVYVRQSSPQQVLEHRESRLRQYIICCGRTPTNWNGSVACATTAGRIRRCRRRPRSRLRSGGHPKKPNQPKMARRTPDNRKATNVKVPAWSKKIR